MSNIQQFSQTDMEILNEEILYQGFFTLKRIQFTHSLFAGGKSGVVTRELLERGEAVAVIAYDPILDNVVLLEQLRIGAFVQDLACNPWLIELIAGIIDENEDANQAAIREAKEEANLSLTQLTHCFSFWNSPGGCRERIHLFAACVDSQNVGGLYGVDDESEDIRVHVIGREQAYQWMCEGKIDNNLAIIGLQWLQLHYAQLAHNWQK